MKHFPSLVHTFLSRSLCLLLIALLWQHDGPFPSLSSSYAQSTTQKETTDFRMALPGYQLQFPRDHGSHKEFRTEWWYYTGHLSSPDGRPFGFQLTFFRRGMHSSHAPSNPSQWTIQDLYLAHFAISDIQTSSFYVAEKVSREALGKAGAIQDRLHVWIDGWKAQGLNGDPQRHHLQASTESFALDLTAAPQKKPILHGQTGLSQKGDLPGQSSHYYSYSRLDTHGTISIQGQDFPVQGISWMDHEFGSADLPDSLAGWDWFSIQLDDGSELMYYLLRQTDGTVHAVSSGTYIPKDGTPLHIQKEDLHIEVGDHWISPKTGTRYPSAWTLTLTPLDLKLHLRPLMNNQELVTTQSTQITYWEGAVEVTGQHKDTPLIGKGYVELTGYAKQFDQPL